MKTKETPIIVVPSEKIEGLLTLEKAKKYQIGLFDTINFKTYCTLNGVSSNYNYEYIILTKTDDMMITYEEPFTKNTIIEIDKKVIRGYNNQINLVYTGNAYHIKYLSTLNKIFPDKESLEEYISLIKFFHEENEKAYREVQNIRIKENQNLEKNKVKIKQAQPTNNISETKLQELNDRELRIKPILERMGSDYIPKKYILKKWQKTQLSSKNEH